MTRSAIQVYCSLRCRRQARLARTVRYCEACGTPYHGIDSRRRFCSRNCAVLNAIRHRGPNAYNWKGGRTLTSPINGYVRVRAPDHPRAKKPNPYVFEHILVMERLLGRYLLPHERVHHKNGRRGDNRPENLELWKMKDPPGVRASDYHCAGCTCDQRPALALSGQEGAVRR
ncbi:MAG TPA: HNH endonuclease [Candidatus Limnocylindria bacterium]